MDKIIFEKSDRQIHASQGEPYSSQPGYHIWYQGQGASDMYLLGYITEDKIQTAVWFYSQEKDIKIYMMRDDD